MEKKLGDLLQAFENNRFQECLRMSDQILKKMQKSDGKKKQNMNQTDINNLYLVRVGSLAITGHVHEANSLMRQKFQTPNTTDEMCSLFLSMTILAMDKRLPEFVTAINENKQRKNVEINKYIFLTHKFSTLSRIFLRKFASGKDYKDSFSQIYLQYLQQLDNQKMINYTRDRSYKQNKQLDFKFVSMFLDKFIASTFKAIEQPKDKIQLNFFKKTKKQIAELKFKIAIHQGNSSLVRKFFIQYQKQVKQNIFVYLRSLKMMNTQKQANSIIWRQQFLKLFKNNLNWQLYQPIYDYSIQFISQFLTETGLNLSELGEPQIIKTNYSNNELGQLFAFKQNAKQQLSNYVNSLFTEYAIQIQHEQIGKKHDFYKIAMKNSLLLLIYIFNLGKKIKLAQQYILKFKEQCGKKLTFPDEIQPYFKNIQIFTKQFIAEFKKAPINLSNIEDKLIWQINVERLFSKDPLEYSLKQNLQQWERLCSLYALNVKQRQKLKKLEKGQRYLSDQFLTIAADSIRKFTEFATSQQLSQVQREQVYFYILEQLEIAISRSPHNHDYKLRAIYFYNKLNYYEDTLKTLESMDIKAVQFQTLGYLYIKNFINFGNLQSNEHLLTRMIKSYQQNYRQSSEYAYKALIGISFNQCQQNLCYCEHIDHSYNFLILLYVLYLKNRGKQNAQFYLKQILYRFKSSKDKLTFNSDFRIIKNVIDSNAPTFVDFYGIYNNMYVLQNQTKIKLLMAGTQISMAQQQMGQLRKSISLIQDLKQIFDFSEYSMFDKRIQYKFGNEQYHHQRITGMQLKLINKINNISLNIFDFVTSLKKQFNQILLKQIFDSIKQLNQSLSQISWRQQTLFLPAIREHVAEIIPLLSSQIQSLSAKKKKVEGQTQKKQSCQDLVTALIDSVTDGIKLQERLKIQKKYLKQSLVHREDLLERVTKMSGNEFKKLYKVKI